MHVSQASPLHRAMPFFVAFILCHGSIGLCQTEETKTELTGTILCDHPISFEDVTLTANYARFRKKYFARPAPASKAEELPPSIPVDASGKFSLSRVAKPMIFVCTFGEKELAGSAQIDERSTKLKIKLEPAVTVTGRLIDTESATPLANKRLIAALRFVDPDRVSNSLAAGSTATETDDDGNFKFSGLVAGRKYNLSCFEISPENNFQLFDAGAFRTNRSRLDLQNIDYSRGWFSSDASPTVRFQRAAAEASFARESMLVVFSTPGDAVFRKFAGFWDNEDLLNALQRFQIIAIDRSNNNAEPAKELAGKLGIELSDNSADTHFCFADVHGNLLQELIISSAEADAFPSKQFLDAAEKNGPTTPNAQTMLDAALKQAAEEGKLVLLQETGPYCGPCVLLSKFLESTRDRWSKDLIWIKLDQRWPGTLEITDRLRKEKKSTIPWYAVLDKEGKTKFTSFTADSKNAGFPGSDSSRKHFRKMLSECCKQMTTEDIDSMIDVLDD